MQKMNAIAYKVLSESRRAIMQSHGLIEYCLSCALHHENGSRSTLYHSLLCIISN